MYLIYIIPCRASKERDSSKNHVIAPDGYNLGRDWFVDRAVEGRRWKDMWWKADVAWRNDLLEEGKKGTLWPLHRFQLVLIGWLLSTGVNHGIPQDGRVAILTVHRL
jgi:hypothetical protein